MYLSNLYIIYDMLLKYLSLPEGHCRVIIQIVSLTPGEMKWLANHLGHDVKILENVYRLQDSTIELAKISRLMMAVDTGHMAEFAGKALNDIHISGNSKHSNCVLDI